VTTPAPTSDVAKARPQPSAWYARMPVAAGLGIGAAVIATQALVLRAFGQPLMCTCGVVRLWAGDVASPENSQQIADWYTLSHVIHGFLFYALLRLALPRASLGARLALALGLEAGWEILENTPLIIDHYRQTALALGYVGDSVLNSVSDTLAATFGFALARKLPVAATIVVALALELVAGVMIRDNLTLNIIQLIHPTAAVSRWQSGH
jgi:hypothetical protein